MNIVKDEILSFKDVFIDELPYNFHYTGSLDLTGSLIKKLPEGLKIGKDLIIGNDLIKELPKRAYIGGDLIINTPNCIENISKSVIVGGIVVGNYKSYKQNFYNNNTVSDHLVTCDNGQRIVFSSWENIAVRYDHFGNVVTRSPMYTCVDLETFVIKYQDKYYIVKSKEDGIKLYNYKDRDLRVKDLGYEKITLDQKFTFEEIYPIYKNLTDTCDEAIPEFKKILAQLGFFEDQKLSIQTWIDGSKHSSYLYNYLFVDFFEKNETKQNNKIKLSITDIS